MHYSKTDAEYLIVLSSEDHFCAMLAGILRETYLLEIIAAAIEDAERCVQRFAPQIVIVDLRGLANGTLQIAIEKVLKLHGVGPVIAIGSNVQGSTVAAWARQGLADYLDWPMDRSLLLQSISNAQKISKALQTMRQEYMSLEERSSTITSGEREVMELVLQGVPNKSIANRLMISQRTVESRRQKVYRKMHSAHLADLVRTVDRMRQLRRELSNPTLNYVAKACSSEPVDAVQSSSR